MAITPMKPTPTPANWAPLVRVEKNSTPNSAVKMGMAPLSNPVTAELMCCSAIGKSVNGLATHSTESATTLMRSAGSTAMGGPGKTASVSAPRPTRNKVTKPGLIDSSPIAMNRKDEPQIPAIETNIAQSIAPKARVDESERTGAEAKGSGIVTVSPTAAGRRRR